MTRLRFTLNGRPVAHDVDDDTPLLTILRDRENLTAAKPACEIGRCGACTVLIDAEPANACLLLPHHVEGRGVTTAEGLSHPPEAAVIRAALNEACAFQCGYCAPGMVVALVALLRARPEASDEEIRAGLSGNLCRCTGYHSILRGARAAADRLKEVRA